MLGKIEGRRRKRQQRMTWLDSITDLIDKNLSKLQEIVNYRGAWLAAVHKEILLQSTKGSKRLRHNLANEQQQSRRCLVLY